MSSPRDFLYAISNREHPVNDRTGKVCYPVAGWVLRVIFLTLSRMKIASCFCHVLACGAMVFAFVPGAFSEQPSHRVSTGPPSSPTPMLLTKADSPSVLTVENIRYHDHHTHTRVVLVLTGAATIRETKGPIKTTIALTNSKLSPRAQQQIQSKDFPHAIAISARESHTVNIALHEEAIRTYKLMTLQNPHRVVVDLFYPQFRMVIDPGHGGKDPGATGRDGTQEKTIVLQVAKTLRDMLQKRLGAKVFLTRSSDVFLNLKKRVKFAEENKADLFISIHANSHPMRSIQGVEIYYFGKASDPRSLAVAARENGMELKENDPLWQFIIADKLHDQKIEASRNFAWTISKTLIPALRKAYTIKDHGVKTAPFHVLRSTPMPGILAEIGFISNPAEEKRLRDKTFQGNLVEGIYQSIRRCIQSSEAPCLHVTESNNSH